MAVAAVILGVEASVCVICARYLEGTGAGAFFSLAAFDYSRGDAVWAAKAVGDYYHDPFRGQCQFGVVQV